MPEAPVPEACTVPGFRLAAVPAGIKASGAEDLGLIVADVPASAAGVFTRNRFQAAPVLLTKSHLAASRGRARAVLVNAGCANACTGEGGVADAEATAAHLAARLDCPSEEVLVCSTGVIGQRLPMEKMREGTDRAVRALDTDGGDRLFARAILTTDLVTKTATATIDGPTGGAIWGVAKGSGMIAPNMATMLGFLLTDISATPAVLEAALHRVSPGTFNAVTVDGDTSTNDTVLLLASGAAKGSPLRKPEGEGFERFVTALGTACASLARQIAADGEGATKCVRVRVVGAVSRADAERAARTVAESPLVKTALFGNDPNWGRIVAALGRSGAAVRPETTSVRLAEVPIFRKGMGLDFDAADLSRRMHGKDLAIEIDLGVGEGEAEILTCDLSYDYVRINAEYHT